MSDGAERAGERESKTPKKLPPTDVRWLALLFSLAFTSLSLFLHEASFTPSGRDDDCGARILPDGRGRPQSGRAFVGGQGNKLDPPFGRCRHFLSFQR